MNSKKILAGVLAVAVLATSGGIYYYKAKTKADTAETLAGTRLQMVDTAGAVVKQNVPLELSFKATVRVCKVTRAIFKISTCKWENREFKRVALTSNEGTYSVGTESYRPLTPAEAKIVVQNLAAEKAGRTLLPDEIAKLDRVTLAAAGIANPTNAQVEGMVAEAFKGYVPPATGEEKTIGKVGNPVASLVTSAATAGAAVAAGSALTVAGVALAAGASVATAGAVVASTVTGAVVPTVITGSTAAVVGNAAASTISTLSSGAHWLFTTPTGWAVLAGVILLSCISTKTTEKWFTLLSVDVKTAGDFYKGGPTTLYYQKDKDTTSEKYKKDEKFAVDLNDFDKTFYGQAADQLYNKFITSNTALTDASKENYKNLLAANVTYMLYARLHGYTEANNEKTISELIAKLTNQQVATDNKYADATNLLKNGSFENGSDDWTLRNEKGGAETVISSNSVVTCPAGTKCLKLTNSGKAFQAGLQKLTLEKGVYRVSAKFKTGEGKARAIVNLHDHTTEVANQVMAEGSSTEWKSIGSEIEITNPDHNYWLYIYNDPSNITDTIYYDNISLQKIS